MITKPSNHIIKPRKTVKVSDLFIIWGAQTTPFWKTLFFKSRKEAFVMLLKQYVRFNRAAMAFQMWGLLRYKPGKNTCGMAILLFSLACMLGYNSAHVPDLLKPLAIFAIPVLVYTKTPEELYELVFIDIESQLLLMYSGLFTLSVLINLVLITLEKSNLSDSKRGESWIVFLFSKFMSVNPFFIRCYVEPVLYIGLGVFAWLQLGDGYFGSYMIFIALAEASQELLDKSFQSHIESVSKI